MCKIMLWGRIIKTYTVVYTVNTNIVIIIIITKNENNVLVCKSQNILGLMKADINQVKKPWSLNNLLLSAALGLLILTLSLIPSCRFLTPMEAWPSLLWQQRIPSPRAPWSPATALFWTMALMERSLSGKVSVGCCIWFHLNMPNS